MNELIKLTQIINYNQSKLKIIIYVFIYDFMIGSNHTLHLLHYHLL